jgi:hypothetical protein
MDATTTGLAQAAGLEVKTITIRADETPVEIEIRKIRVKQFVDVFKKIDELVDAGVVKLTDETGAFIFSAKGIFTQFSEAKLILRGGDPALDIVSIISRIPRAEIDELDLLDLAKVVGAAWEVNQRFFVRNQTEIKLALGPIWTIAETVIAALQPKAAAAPETTAEPIAISTPAESFPASLISSSLEATEPSIKS